MAMLVDGHGWMVMLHYLAADPFQCGPGVVSSWLHRKVYPRRPSLPAYSLAMLGSPSLRAWFQVWMIQSNRSAMNNTDNQTHE